MGLIPQSFIDEVLARTDLVNLIDARVPLKKAGKDYVARCPFHQEKTPSFHVSPDKQIYYCFGCHAHGNAIRFLMEYERLSFPEAIGDLAQAAGLPLPADNGKTVASTESHRDLLEQLEAATRLFQQSLRESPQAREYLRRRGLDDATIERFALGYAPARWDFLLQQLGRNQNGRERLLANGLVVARERGDGYYDRFRDRIIFPIWDHRGRIVGFGGRVIDGDKQPKYLNSPETQLYHKSEVLYGFHQAREAIRTEQRVLVVEGYMDVIALHQQDIAFAVATSGTATTNAHLERLFRAAPEIIFCFDGDRAGREAAWRALESSLEALQEGRLLRFLFLPEGEDPDSLIRHQGRDAFLQRLSQATPALDYLFDRLSEQVDLQQRDGRARLASLAKPYLDKVPTGPMRMLYEQRLRELVGLEPIQIRHKPRPQRPVRRSVPVRLSLVGRSLALLLQHPGHPAWREVDRQRLDTLGDRGIPLFCRALDIVLETPHITTAMLLSRFEDDPAAAKLASLASRNLAAEFAWKEDDQEKDITGCVEALNHLARQARFEALKQRAGSKETPLSPEELQEFLLLMPRRRPSRGS